MKQYYTKVSIAVFNGPRLKAYDQVFDMVTEGVFRVSAAEALWFPVQGLLVGVRRECT